LAGRRCRRVSALETGMQCSDRHRAAGTLSSNASAANAGSVTLAADERGWTQTCYYYETIVKHADYKPTLRQLSLCYTAVCPSVCPSVCLSVTGRYCIETSEQVE